MFQEADIVNADHNRGRARDGGGILNVQQGGTILLKPAREIKSQSFQAVGRYVPPPKALRHGRFGTVRLIAIDTR